MSACKCKVAEMMVDYALYKQKYGVRKFMSLVFIIKNR